MLAKLRKCVRKITNRFLGFFGFKIIRISSSFREWPDLLNHIKSKGFLPKTVIDVGAASITDYLYDAFPGSRILLIEPLKEFEVALKKTCNLYNAEYVLKAVGAKTGELKIYVDKALAGTSMFQIENGEHYNLKERVVPQTTLDKLDSEKKFEVPILLKIDVEGGELEVLKGGLSVLQKCEVVILETSLFLIRKDQPIFYDSIVFMKNHDFVLFDLIQPVFTVLEKDLGIVDLVFVKEDGIFRSERRWMSHNQVKNNLPSDFNGFSRLD